MHTTNPLKLLLGAYTVTAKKYKMSPRTVKRICYQYLESSVKSKNGVGGDVRNNKRNLCGKKRNNTVLDSLDDMLKIPKRMNPCFSSETCSSNSCESIYYFKKVPLS